MPREMLLHEAERAGAAEAKLAKAREALREIMSGLDGEDEDFPGHVYGICRAALSDEEPKPNPAPGAEPRSTTHHPWLTPDQFYNLGVTELPAAYADLAATVEELERRNGWLPPDEVERPREALRELVRVMSHQLARGEDPEEGAFDRAWVAACAALSDKEPAPESPMAAAARALREKGEQEKAQQESRHCCRGAFLCDKHWPGEKP